MYQQVIQMENILILGLLLTASGMGLWLRDE